MCVSMEYEGVVDGFCVGWRKRVSKCKGEKIGGSDGSGVDGWGALVNGQRLCRHGAERSECDNSIVKRWPVGAM